MLNHLFSHFALVMHGEPYLLPINMDNTSTITDLESAINECSYTNLPDNHHYHTQSEDSSSSSLNGFKPLKSFVYTFSILLFICSTVFVIVGYHQRSETHLSILPPTSKITPSSRGVSETLSSILPPTSKITPSSRGVSEGVSEKSNANKLFADSNPFPWTNNMLSWQRTCYHFQPQQNWMNDPNGPLYYKGWYHFFYQYNPVGAVWGNIVWGHAVSKDLINWQHLPIAMAPDQWYDINGVFTGSATILADGSVVMLYTGGTNESVQVQNVAYPADPNDPLLLEWVKYEKNPVLLPPPGIGLKDFRDPTTAWRSPNGNWKISIGSRLNTTLGMALVYETPDFINYKLKDGLLHSVPGTGEWECVDLYPVSVVEENGLDTSVNGPNVKHVLKASLEDVRGDYYAIGVYDEAKDVYTPDNPELDVGLGLKYDYGHFYASKTFYDQLKQRRILWGWISETDSEPADIAKGWSSVQAVPREVTFDKKTRTNLIQWPVKEVEDLRLSNKTFEDVKVETGSVVRLDVDTATQVDITAEFEIDEKALEGVLEAGVGYDCTTSGGAAGRGALGPFGLLVLADGSLTEQTAVYFYIAKGVDGNLNTFFCTDNSRSSKANDVNKQIYGSTVPVLKGEKLSVRLLVDHSIVEAFAQGGRTCITSRVYPTEAINGPSGVFLFNNATGVSVTAKKVKIWEMNSALLHPYDFSQ